MLRLDSYWDLMLDSQGQAWLRVMALAPKDVPSTPANSIPEATFPSTPFRKSCPQQNISPSPYRSVSPCVHSTIAGVQEAPEKANPKKSPGRETVLHSQEVAKARVRET